MMDSFEPGKAVTMQNLLILSPEQSDLLIDFSALIHPLSHLGLLGAPYADQASSYRPGERFLQLITYLGCSPVISLGEPGMTGDEFAQITLVNTQERQLIYGDNVKVPRCPNCRHQYDRWRNEVELWRNGAITCPKCQHETSINQLNWRQCCGYGRSFIKISGIFEGEALPSDLLLNALSTATSVPWGYFYVQLRER